jgi:hypothetical protein
VLRSDRRDEVYAGPVADLAVAVRAARDGVSPGATDATTLDRRAARAWPLTAR